MISLRRFTVKDAGSVQKLYPDMPPKDVCEMIARWETGSFQGRRFEMYAITTDALIVGSVSLFERSNSVVSLGVEICPDQRRKGYAYEALRLMIERSKALGYRAVQNQVRTDNLPSIALHDKLGFETDGYVYKNAKGKDVILCLLCL